MKKNVAAALAGALSLSLAAGVVAADKPVSSKAGVQKSAQGSCGAAKAAEGSCGAAAPKAGEGKCGEGKCGSTVKKAPAKNAKAAKAKAKAAFYLILTAISYQNRRNTIQNGATS